jgi:hypothetical protein
MFSHEHEVEMTRRYRKDHDLAGREADDLLSIFDTLDEGDIWQYRYPEDDDLERVGVRGIYLGNYVRWDPKAQHEQMIRTHGYLSASFARTFDTYDHTDCYNFMDLHDYLKQLKHGYSKVTDHASREIRHGRLTREEGAALVRRHADAPLRHVGKFCEWLGIDAHGLNFIMNQHRNPLYWEQASPGVWNRINPLLPETEAAPIDAGFIANSTLSLDRRDAYITIGKGWP